MLIDECWLGRRWVVETDIASCLEPWSCTVGERAERITLAEGPAELIEITTGAAVMTTNESAVRRRSPRRSPTPTSALSRTCS